MMPVLYCVSTAGVYLYRRVCVCACVSVCVSFQAYTRRRLWSDRDQIWHTHMQIHLEKVVGTIKICPVSRRGNLGGGGGGFRGSEIENVGNLPNGWTD